MKIKYRKNSINIRIISFIVYNLVYVLYMLGYLSRNVNIFCLFLFSFICLFSCLKKTKFSFVKETKSILIFIIFIIIVSLVKQMYYSDYNLGQMVGILYILLPIVDAFLIINTTKDENILDYLYVIFVRMVMLFILQNIENFNLASITNINWLDSESSIFESSMAHEFLFMTIILKYLKKNKLAILSTVLCLLCFKRLSFILCIIVLLFFNRINLDKPVNKKLLTISKIFFMLTPFILTYLISDSGQLLFYKIFNIDLNKFTTGRTYYINLVKNNLPYFNGYGSTQYYLANVYRDEYVTNMHCDFLRLTWECTIFSVIIYVNNILSMVKKNYILFFMIIYCLIEMFISHFIEGMSTWLILYLFIYIVNNNICNKGEKNE